MRRRYQEEITIQNDLIKLQAEKKSSWRKKNFEITFEMNHYTYLRVRILLFIQWGLRLSTGLKLNITLKNIHSHTHTHIHSLTGLSEMRFEDPFVWRISWWIQHSSDASTWNINITREKKNKKKLKLEEKKKSHRIVQRNIWFLWYFLNTYTNHNACMCVRPLAPLIMRIRIFIVHTINFMEIVQNENVCTYMHARTSTHRITYCFIRLMVFHT